MDPPEAISRAVSPKQMIVSLLTVAVGKLCKEMVILSVLIQPLRSVPVTV